MNKFETVTPGKGKYSRKFKKYPRQMLNKALESFEKISMHGTYKKLGWDVEYTERTPYLSWNRMCRFIESNLGCNADTVYSRFVNKCKGVKLGCAENNLRKEFVSAVYIPNESKISDINWAPFTVDNENKIINNPKKYKHWKIGNY